MSPFPSSSSSPVSQLFLPPSMCFLFSSLSFNSHWVHIALSLCEWVQILVRGYPLRAYVPKESWPFLLSSHPLPIAPQTGLGLQEPPAPSVLGFWLAWSCDSLVHAVFATVSSWGRQLCCHVQQILFRCTHPSLWLLESFSSIFLDDPRASRGSGVM